MANIIGLGWLNTNATRNYPLSQEAVYASDVGFALPDDLILDMRLSVPYSPTIKPFYFYLKAISAFAHGLIVEIGYHNPKSSAEEATVAVSEAIAVDTHTSPSSYILTGVATNDDYDFSNVVGTISIGNLAQVAENAPGRVEFGTEAYIESTVISLNTVGVSSLRVGDSLQGSGTALTGHVVMRPRTNFGIQVSTLENSLAFSALDGLGLESDCTCEGEINLGPCIRTVNSLPPDNQGNIDLAAGTCISIATAGTNTILISETCSEPCCGCEQLDIFVADLRDLESGFERLDSYITALAGAVESIRSSAFGSVIAASGCSSPV